MDNSQQSSRAPSTEAPGAEQNDADDGLHQSQEYRHPSPGVQAAYNRLRQVRRDLLELSDNLHARIAAEENLIGPGYEALVLTEPSTEEGSGGQRAENHTNTAANATSGSPAPRTLFHPVGLSLPLVPVRPPRRRPTMESSLRLARDMDPNDSNTLLGRRVAARVAERANHSPSNSPNPPGTDGVAVHSQQNLRRNILSSQALVAARAPIPSRRASETQRSEVAQSGQQVQTDRQDRLSLLSNFSVQNFSTPRSGTLRPLIFDEPTSYIDQDTVQYSSSLEPLVEGAVPARSYVVNRRFNTDGEEYVHNINLHWSEDAGSFNIEGPTQQHRIPGVASTRRRGWARLDPDGDEISEVEERSQHSRAAFRTYELQRARRAVTGNEHTESCFDEWEELGNEYNVLFNSHETLRRRSNPYVGKNSIRQFTSAPFRPNPLPMPITQMVDIKTSNTGPTENDFVIFLPHTARLAGR